MGTIYTIVLLKQWIDWSLGKTLTPEEIWQNLENHYYDLFCPNSIFLIIFLNKFKI